MSPPHLASVIERRLLVNYRVDPEVAAALLPSLLRPQRLGGWAVAGICLIRLGQVRPRRFPGVVGVRSENAAHRIAVEWDGPAGVETGVYIPRRDSGSALNVMVGGRLFPGMHHRARFDVREAGQDLHVAYASRDGSTRVSVDVSTVEHFHGSQLFADLEAASEFFRHGSMGLSPRRDGPGLDGLRLGTDSWQVAPVEARAVRSTFFDDRGRFPQGSATFDCALLMREIAAMWSPARSVQIPGSQEVSALTC
jgi:hypothetical protein